MKLIHSATASRYARILQTPVSVVAWCSG